MFTQTIPLPEGGGVFAALDAGAAFADFAGAAAGAGALELAAGAGVDFAGADAGAAFGLALAESDDAVLAFLLRLFFAAVAEESSAVELLAESVDAVLVPASAEVFFDRDFFDPVELSAVLVDVLEASPDADFEDFVERVFLVPPVSVAEPDAAEVSAADDFDDLDFFDVLVELPLESEISLADVSVAAAFFLDLLWEAPEELSVALASELAAVFLLFFLLAVVLLLRLASDC